MKKVTGIVKWFNTEKGYGFIPHDGEDVFIHYRAILQEGFKNLKEGDRVEFYKVKSEKGWNAQECEILPPTGGLEPLPHAYDDPGADHTDSAAENFGNR